MNDTVTEEFTQGVDAYWGGEVPEGWQSQSTREQSPYLMGWYMASLWETQPGYLRDLDGDPLQDED